MKMNLFIDRLILDVVKSKWFVYKNSPIVWKVNENSFSVYKNSPINCVKSKWKWIYW